MKIGTVFDNSGRRIILKNKYKSKLYTSAFPILLFRLA